MPSRTLDLEFPLGGLDRRPAFQKQRPFTTPHAVNVRPEGTLEKRLRGGSRPGLVKSFATRDSDNKVNLLTMMRSLNTEGRRSFKEDFSSGFDYAEWENMGQSGMRFPINVVDEQVKVYEGEFMGGVLRNTSGTPGEKLNTSGLYSVEMWFDPSSLVVTGGQNNSIVKAHLYALLEDSGPRLDVGLSLELRQWVNSGGLALFDTDLLFVINNNVQGGGVRLLSNSTQPIGSGTLRLVVDGMIFSGSWIPDPGQSGIEQTIIISHLSSNSRVGFGVDIDHNIGGNVFADNFLLRYISTDTGIPPEAVVQAANGNLLRESTEGGLVAVTQTGITLASDRSLLAVDRLGKLYIADHGNRFSTDGTEEARQVDGIVDSGSPTLMTSAGVTDWTDMGIEKDGDWLEIISVDTASAANRTLAVGLHKVAAQITGANLILAGSLGIDDDISGITYRIVRGPKVFDAATNTMALWEPTAGSIPLGCNIIEVFRDRMVLGGDPENPGVWFMGRVGNPDDFNYGASVTDRSRAIPGTTVTSEGGGLAIPLSAIVALTEDYCLFSAESELYLLRGDLGLGGIIGNISRQIGIGSRTAWCRIPDGSLVFLSRDGLYKFHPSQPFPESLSRDKLPAELINVVQNTDLTVTLEYDVRFRGVHIFIAPATAGSSKHYWFDWDTQGFCPVALGSTDHEPFAITFDAKANHVLLGCRDGYIRHHDSGAVDDDGIAVVKEVDYGPIPLNRGRAAFVDSLKITLDDGSADVPWTFRTGNSPEEAFNAAPRALGTAKAGRNYLQSIRHYGEWGFLRLSTTGAVRWAVEAIELKVLTTPTKARKI